MSPHTIAIAIIAFACLAATTAAAEPILNCQNSKLICIGTLHDKFPDVSQEIIYGCTAASDVCEQAVNGADGLVVGTASRSSHDIIGSAFAHVPAIIAKSQHDFTLHTFIKVVAGRNMKSIVSSTATTATTTTTTTAAAATTTTRRRRSRRSRPLRKCDQNCCMTVATRAEVACRAACAFVIFTEPVCSSACTAAMAAASAACAAIPS